MIADFSRQTPSLIRSSNGQAGYGETALLVAYLDVEGRRDVDIGIFL
ncbi:hypothetical protein ACVR0S_05515 [Streptococcus dentapri]|uniref:Uncharacterized protein n=1 Tax=Streptococcus dentapri TaxID=573564 RepID=A0ABV8D031_9STRE